MYPHKSTTPLIGYPQVTYYPLLSLGSLLQGLVPQPPPGHTLSLHINSGPDRAPMSL